MWLDGLKYLEVCVSVWRSKPCVSVSSSLRREHGAARIRCDLQCMLCVKRRTTAPDREPSGTWLVCARSAFARFDLLPVCVFTWRAQAVLNHCHSQRRRETLMFSHSDTYRTPLSWTLTALRADARVLSWRAVTSHQTAAPRPLAWSSSFPPQSYFPFPLSLMGLKSFSAIHICSTLEEPHAFTAPKQTHAGSFQQALVSG